MNEALKNLETRRSSRSYTAEQISDSELEAILNAGLYAPTGMNRQETYFVAVRNKDIRDKIAKLNAAVMGGENDPFYGAPCVIAVLSAPNFTAVEDGSLALGNMMNAAHALGLGSCWIHRAKQVFEAPEGKELLKEWGLPEDLIGVGNCILGHITELPEAKPRKEGRIVKVD